MKELNGIWWTIDQNQSLGKLTITDENEIILITDKKLYETNIINGFAEGKDITLVNATLDLTKEYYKPEKINECDGIIIERSKEVKYCEYTYIAEIAIFGQNYKRKGDITFEKIQIKFTNLEEWVGWKSESPTVKKTEENIILELKKFPENKVNLEKFNLSIEKLYFLTGENFNMQIHNETVIVIDNIYNTYIEKLEFIIKSIQDFLILCIGDNMNLTKIKAIDVNGKYIEMILSIGKSNYKNRSKFKNIIKYEDIKENLEEILKNWINIYSDEKLLILNFINLQTKKETLVSEIKNLTSAIDSLYLAIIKKNKTNEHFAEMVKRILREINFISNFSEEQIQEIAIKVKDIRRYFVHSNKTQEELVESNISYVTNLMAFLLEVIRIRVLLEIGVNQKILEKYYKESETMQELKKILINNINANDLEDERVKEGKMIIRPLSKREKNEIAHLNAILQTGYREGGYDLENSEDLIEAVINVTAEFMDYKDQWGRIVEVYEDFDQTLEVFHPEKWFKTMKGEDTGHKLFDEAMASLENAIDNLQKLEDEAKQRCREVWQFLLTGNNEEVKKHFLGDISKYSKEELLEALDITFYNICEVEYKCQIHEDTQNFANDIIWNLENR